jgi:hypothetical protein
LISILPIRHLRIQSSRTSCRCMLDTPPTCT